MGLTGRRAARDQARGAGIRPPEVTVHIDRVVLEGFDDLHAPTIVEAIQSDLGRLMTRDLPAWWHASLAVDAIEAAPIVRSSGASAQDVGGLVATTVHRGVGRFAEDPSKP